MNWLTEKLIPHGIPALVKYGVAFAIAHNVDSLLSHVGVTVDWSKFQVVITAFLGMCFEVAEEYFKEWKLKSTSPGAKQ